MTFHQVGIARIVVGFAVTGVAVAFDQDALQRRRLHLDALGTGRLFGGMDRKIGQMLVIGGEIHMRPLQGGQQQCGFGERDIVVLPTPDLFKRLDENLAPRHVRPTTLNRGRPSVRHAPPSKLDRASINTRGSAGGP